MKLLNEHALGRGATPKLICACRKSRALVMEFLSNSLSHQFEKCRFKLSLKTCLMLAINMVCCLARCRTRPWTHSSLYSLNFRGTFTIEPIKFTLTLSPQTFVRDTMAKNCPWSILDTPPRRQRGFQVKLELRSLWPGLSKLLEIHTRLGKMIWSPLDTWLWYAICVLLYWLALIPHCSSLLRVAKKDFLGVTSKLTKTLPKLKMTFASGNSVTASKGLNTSPLLTPWKCTYSWHGTAFDRLGNKRTSTF